MVTSSDRVWRVERALQDKVGPRASEVMHKKTKFLANLSPRQVAEAPSGDRIVFAELDRIVLQTLC